MKIVNTLAASAGKQADEIIVYELGSNSERATWGVPQVAISIAQWLSPEFEVRVSNWIYELGVYGKIDLKYKHNIQDIEYSYLRQLKEKDEKIDDLKHEINNYESIHFQQLDDKTIENIADSTNISDDILYKLSLFSFVYVLATNFTKEIIYNGKIYTVRLISYGHSQGIQDRLKTHKTNYPGYKLLLLCNVSNSLYAEKQIRNYLKTIDIHTYRIRDDGTKDKELFHTRPDYNITKVLSNIRSICLETVSFGIDDVKINELQKELNEYKTSKIDNESLKSKLEKQDEIIKELRIKNKLYYDRINSKDRSLRTTTEKMIQAESKVPALLESEASLRQQNISLQQIVDKLVSDKQEVKERESKRFCVCCNIPHPLESYSTWPTGNVRLECNTCHDKNIEDDEISDDTNKCTYCGRVRPIGKFYMDTTCKNTCITCISQQKMAKTRKDNFDDYMSRFMAEELLKNLKKKCTGCSIIKDITSFAKQGGHRDGYRSRCNQCERKRARDRYYNKIQLTNQ